MTKADKSKAPPAIDPAAHYSVAVGGRFDFEGIEFGPLAQTEVLGELLDRLLASDKADKVNSYQAV